ncbi:cytochrome P450 [Frankia sp. Ag45/Mut15]|uniref:Cytochrome P450 n=1 Tax=Frankia umida TaxID=573489 RepID=A0ABT0K3S6_9ACTN|nr:cytochrome P450 [Frankia umida]MCK9878445.1 cytochrome P450 [Frankia umida]
MTTVELPADAMDPTRDDRKSAKIAAGRVRPEPGAREVGGFGLGREVLRSGQMLQAGVSGDRFSPEDRFCPVFFLDGERHKKARTAIARYFTPKAINTHHRLVMERTTERLLGRLRATGTARLDELSYELAVAVAAEIIGLTGSDQATMAGRIEASLFATRVGSRNKAVRFGVGLVSALHAGRFYLRDVRPAIRARRAERRDDVISHLIDESYPDRAILVECMTYAVAGMVTTREFIVMAAWHLFEDDALRARFVAADAADQTAILEEILRLEPVAAMLHRRAERDVAFTGAVAAAGDVLAINIRAANVDPAAVGACPHALDPDRGTKQKQVGSFLSFGDGSHRCPGAQVAMAESRIFLDGLFAVPGIRLERAPDLTWFDGLGSYELRHAVIACTPAPTAD